MTDMEDRFRSLDRVQMPELWGEATLRAAAEPQREMRRTGQQSRPALLLVAALLLALVVGGTALVLSGVVEPPVVPDGSATLAYALDGDIYLADWNGRNPTRIADGDPFEGNCPSFRAEGPMWSPDGRYLAYRSGWNMDCVGTVHLSDADGHPVASFPGEGWLISWSPDSTRVATWVDFNYGTIGIYGIDGVRQTLLAVTCPWNTEGVQDPQWSPDGQSLWLPGCEIPIDGSRPFPPGVAAEDPRARWTATYSPDGTRVAYVRVGTGELVEAAADGSGARVLSVRVVPPQGDPALPPSVVWSPSGDRIAYHGGGRRSITDGVSVPEGLWVQDGISVVDVRSAVITSLASGESIYLRGFSPDGDRILFAKFDSLWSVDADGSDEQVLVSGTAWGQWQPQLRIPAESVAGVCAFYSMDADSPMELLAAASNASLQMDYTEEMAFRREAVEALNALADQLSGEARDDVLVLAEAVSDAPSTHIARYGWTPAFDVFTRSTPRLRRL